MAVTLRASVMGTVQVPVPEQPAPLQPAKTEVAAGVAVSVTIEPARKEPLQTAPQEMPGVTLVTTPEPVPARPTVSVVLGARSKTAVTLCGAFMPTTQAPVPEQAPDQPTNVDPGKAVAESVTEVPETTLALQDRPQSIPAGVLATVPEPVPVLATVRVRLTARLKVAVTLAADVTATTQAPLPEHAPLHPAKTDPRAGVAVRVTVVPEATDTAQARPQLIPAGLLATVPEPFPLLVTETRWLTRGRAIAWVTAETKTKNRSNQIFGSDLAATLICHSLRQAMVKLISKAHPGGCPMAICRATARALCLVSAALVVDIASSEPTSTARVNLMVELRQVQMQPDQVVSHTTDSPHQARIAAQQIRVRNGGRAVFALQQSIPLQWVTAGFGAWRDSRDGPKGQGPSAMGGFQQQIVVVQAGQSLAVEPRWREGQASVELAIDLQRTGTAPGANTVLSRQNTTQLATSVYATPGEWVTIASTAGAPSPGTVSTRTAAQRGMVLQVRVLLD